MGLGADQIFAAALDVDLGDGLIVILALVGITFLLIITLGVLDGVRDPKPTSYERRMRGRESVFISAR